MQEIEFNGQNIKFEDDTQVKVFNGKYLDSMCRLYISNDGDLENLRIKVVDKKTGMKMQITISRIYENGEFAYLEADIHDDKI